MEEVLDLTFHHSLNFFCLDFLLPPSHWLGNATIEATNKILCWDSTVTLSVLGHVALHYDMRKK